MNIKINDNFEGYKQRTRYNCKQANYTLIFCKNESSAGTKYTKECCEDNYSVMHFNPLHMKTVNRKMLNEELAKITAEIKEWMDNTNNDIFQLHVAGNRIKIFGETQYRVNSYIEYCLDYIQMQLDEPIIKVFSGGQTGADVAGACWALKNEINLEINMPSGFLRQDECGNNVKGLKHLFVDLDLSDKYSWRK